MTTKSFQRLYKMGDRVPYYGVVVGMGCWEGDRYYFLQDGNCTAMMPVDVIDKKPSRRS